MIRAIFTLLFAVSILSAEPGDFENANRLYEKGDFAGAAATYQKLTNNATAAVYFNLGNALFRDGHVGRAILAYRQAGILSPRDPDIRANLRFALGSVPGNTARITPVERALRLLTVNELGILTAIALWLCFGSLALGQVRRDLKPKLRNLAIGSGVVSLGLLAWFGEALWNQKVNRPVIVVQETARAHFGPLPESQVAYTLRDGNELRAIGRKDNWLQVIDASGRVGWIPDSDIAMAP